MTTPATHRIPAASLRRRRSARAGTRPSAFVFRFDQLPEVKRTAKTWDEVKALLGGKGANLAEMTRLALPVPPGFTVTTEACRAFLKSGNWPKGLWEEEVAALHDLESRTGKRFGDPANPLLVSCRSGAKFSMPGMMDTVLNIGLNAQTVEGLATLTGDPRFAWDAYRRLVQMYGTVVLGVRDEPFEHLLAEWRARRRVENDADLEPEDLRTITARFRAIVREQSGREFPDDPMEQLRLATEAVFRSWQGKRAQDYRRAAGIPDDLGTAVNIVAMVFGNMGRGSATGVATTRNVSTGENALEGDYLINAQGEDVVAGIRADGAHRQAGRGDAGGVHRAAAHRQAAREALPRGAGHRVHGGARHALDAPDPRRQAHRPRRGEDRGGPGEGEADHPRGGGAAGHSRARRLLPPPAVRPRVDARRAGRAAAPGERPQRVTGRRGGTAGLRRRYRRAWAKEKKAVVMIRAETKPDDVHGMLAARGILTSRGGRTSHAALVARQFGKPAVVGVMALEVDAEKKEAAIKRSSVVLREGDWVSIDGTTGEVFLGQVETMQPSLEDPALIELLGWADRFRRLGVWANADYPRDAQRARALGAEGIGLCRTEHMFFETDRLPLVQKLILSRDDTERDEVLDKLLPLQRADFEGLFRAMDGQPVTIRLIDPPLHEFLPAHDTLLKQVTELETRLELKSGNAKDQTLDLAGKRTLLGAVERLREMNPMLGLRGVRLGIHMPGLVRMQVRAIFEAACACAEAGIEVFPKIMIPLVTHGNELRWEQRALEAEAKKVMAEQKRKVRYQFGTMIEIPRAAITADEIASLAQFFSFGTNDLTQTTFGISRDDAETSFLTEYLTEGILPENPFDHIDEGGVGRLMEMAVQLGRKVRPGLNIGICGEHGGDPKSIAFCHRIGLDYVSCSPFRVPVARLAAAHAALHEGKKTAR